MSTVAPVIFWLAIAAAPTPEAVAHDFVSHYLRQGMGVELDAVPRLKPFLSRRLKRILADAAACQADWVRHQPKGSTDKPPFVDCCLFASSPEGLPTSFQIGSTEATADGRIKVFVDYTYADPPGTYSDPTIPLGTSHWRDALILIQEGGFYRIDDFIYMRDPGDSGLLSKSFEGCRGPKWVERP